MLQQMTNEWLACIAADTHSIFCRNHHIIKMKVEKGKLTNEMIRLEKYMNAKLMKDDVVHAYWDRLNAETDE